ncbi:hypothetical protein [Ornithinibacillus contaminans]|uniref:hypothetical protein n=1 Tax=Ornithinibacillus contaminans TaxID=694055 RepID=UPI00064D72BD|nr:hypothetical protein [Ornithinibacillus contaminans]
MDTIIQSYFDNLHAEDKQKQYESFQSIMEAIDKPVDWAYDVWEQLVENLTHSDNHERARAAQFLCGLAKSDHEKRILKDFNAIWQVTYDKKFVTARHTIQSIWKIGLAGPEQKELLLIHLADRYRSCINEKNYTLIRHDILVGLRKLYDQIDDESIKTGALQLIEEEEDPKYKKKYATVWRNV